MKDLLASADLEVPSCSKWDWVSSTVVEDESNFEYAEIPQAVRLHTSHCSYCRSHVEQLLTTLSSLSDLSFSEPDSGLCDRVQAKVSADLLSSGRISGVVTPDEPNGEYAELRNSRSLWPQHRTLAIAAAVILSVAGGLIAMTLVEVEQPSLAERSPNPDISTFYEVAPKDGALQGDDSVAEAVLSSPSIQEREASSTQLAEEGGKRTPRKPIRFCNPRNHFEAALNEDAECVQRIMILSAPASRGDK